MEAWLRMHAARARRTPAIVEGALQPDAAMERFGRPRRYRVAVAAELGATDRITKSYISWRR